MAVGQFSARVLKMPTRNVNLSEHYDRFVSDQIAAGKFSSASEVMRAGLHLLEQRTSEDEQKITLLKSLAAEGFSQLDQGRGIEVDGEQQLASFVQRIGRRAAKPVNSKARRA